MKKNLIILFINSLVFFQLLVYSTFVYATTPNTNVTYFENKEINLETSPESSVFEITRMIPGDWASREIVISNNGDEDLRYLFKEDFISGSKKYYKSLILKISDNSGEIYYGNLSDFQKLASRFLASTDKETLTFTIMMPFELGNEYQGLSTEFQFKFYVEGTLGGILPVDNRLPTTATDIFEFLLVGAVLTTAGATLFIYQKRKKQDSKRT